MNNKKLTLVLLTVITSVYTADTSSLRGIIFTNNTPDDIVVCSGKSLGSNSNKKTVKKEETSTLQLPDNSLMISTNSESAYAPDPSIVNLPAGITGFSITFDYKNNKFTVTPVR